MHVFDKDRSEQKTELIDQQSTDTLWRKIKLHASCNQVTNPDINRSLNWKRQELATGKGDHGLSDQKIPKGDTGHEVQSTRL